MWVPSEMTQEIVAQRFGVRAQRVPYCYDSDRFVPRADTGAEATGTAPPTLLTVSRLRRHKNRRPSSTPLLCWSVLFEFV